MRASVVAEKAGIPTVTIVATGFLKQAQATAKALGMANLTLAEYPGIIMTQSQEELRGNAGDEVLITEMEHHANIVPWHFLREKAGVVLKWVPVTNDGELAFRTISRDFLKDSGQIWSYPVHIRTRDILPIAGLAALTGFLIGNDEAVRRGILHYRDDHAWVRAASPVVTRMGTYGAWGTAAIFLGVGLIGGSCALASSSTNRTSCRWISNRFPEQRVYPGFIS